jgi:hypothetical protein
LFAARFSAGDQARGRQVVSQTLLARTGRGPARRSTISTTTSPFDKPQSTGALGKGPTAQERILNMEKQIGARAVEVTANSITNDAVGSGFRRDSVEIR